MIEGNSSRPVAAALNASAATGSARETPLQEMNDRNHSGSEEIGLSQRR
jgi:hypothetical protein